LLDRVSLGVGRLLVRAKAECSPDFGQPFLHWTLFQRTQKDACEVTHGIGDTGIQLASAKLIDRISESAKNAETSLVLPRG
jgi:hypothetical protein